MTQTEAQQKATPPALRGRDKGGGGVTRSQETQTVELPPKERRKDTPWLLPSSPHPVSCQGLLLGKSRRKPADLGAWGGQPMGSAPCHSEQGWRWPRTDLRTNKLGTGPGPALKLNHPSSAERQIHSRHTCRCGGQKYK